MMMKYALTFLIFLFLQMFESSFASENHHDSDDSHENNKFGEGKALVKADKNRGFILSDEAVNTLGIKTNTIAKIDEIPKSSIVSMIDKKGIYVLRNNYFKFIEFNSKMKLQKKEQIVVTGQNLLLITDIYSTDETEYSH